MAVLKFVNGKNTSKVGLKKAIKYATNESKTDILHVSGKNCDTDNAYEQFLMTQKIHGKDNENGRRFIHFIQSFAPDDNIDPDKAHLIGCKLLEDKMFDGFEIVCATHLDKDHLHNHFIVNAVNRDTGIKWHSSISDIYNLREASDLLCLSHGASVLKNEIETNMYVSKESMQDNARQRKTTQDNAMHFENHHKTPSNIEIQTFDEDFTIVGDNYDEVKHEEKVQDNAMQRNATQDNAMHFESYHNTPSNIEIQTFDEDFIIVGDSYDEVKHEGKVQDNARQRKTMQDNAMQRKTMHGNAMQSEMFLNSFEEQFPPDIFITGEEYMEINESDMDFNVMNDLDMYINALADNENTSDYYINPDFNEVKDFSSDDVNESPDIIKNPESVDPKFKELKKVIDSLNTATYLSSINCNVDSVYDEFINTKSIHDNGNSKNKNEYYTFIQVIKKEDMNDISLAHSIAEQFAKRFELFNDFEVCYGTFEDDNAIYTKYVINNYGYDNGQRFHVNRENYHIAKDLFAELLIENDIILEKKEARDKSYVNSGMYRAVKEERSWKHELSLAIKECRNTSKDRFMFMDRMKALGYDVEWNFKYEDFDTEYVAQTIDICLRNSRNRDELKDNLNNYGVNMEWNYKLKLTPYLLDTNGEVYLDDDGNKMIDQSIEEEFKFNSYEALKDKLNSIDHNKYVSSWSDDIIYTYNDINFSPESFVKGHKYRGDTLIKSLEINEINNIEPNLPKEIIVEPEDSTYKNLLKIATTVKQLSFDKDDFVMKMSLYGYETTWDVKATEREIFKAVIKECQNRASDVDHFKTLIQNYGFNLYENEKGITIKKNIDMNFSLSKYDTNHIFKILRKGASPDQIEKSILTDNLKDKEKQLSILYSRLDKLQENGYVEFKDGSYMLTEKALDTRSNKFEFTKYDKNVIIGLINSNGGYLSKSELYESLKKEYSGNKLNKQYNYITNRIRKNIKIGTIDTDEEGNFFVTYHGKEECKRIDEEIKLSKESKIKNPSYKISLSKLENLIEKSSSENVRSLEEITKDIEERKNFAQFSIGEKTFKSTQLSPKKQFTKDQLEETFFLNSEFKKIVLLSLSNKISLSRAAVMINDNYEIEHDKRYRRYNFKCGDLECYFSEDNYNKILSNVLPDKHEILDTKDIKYTTPDGKVCLASQFGGKQFNIDELEKSFANNLKYQELRDMNEKFGNLLFALNLLKSRDYDHDKKASKFPLSKLEGDKAIKEKIAEMKKGKSFNYDKHNNLES